MIRVFPIPKGNEMLYIIIHEGCKLKTTWIQSIDCFNLQFPRVLFLS